jgi:raffinose/stachyose/melibiose transport system permease protein
VNQTTLTFSPLRRWTKTISLRQRETILAWLALIPAFALYFLFTLYPLLLSMYYSTTDWNGYSATYKFVGIGNFVKIFQDKSIAQAATNTFYFAAVSLTIGLPLQMIFALILGGRLRGRNIARAILYVPALFSSVIVALTWTSLLQYTGVFNEFFRAINADFLVTNWLGDADIVMKSLVMINMWQYTGLGTVILLTGLVAIPPELLEAARLDGAQGFTLFRKMTLPLLMPSVTVNLFVGITGALRLFELPLIMTKGAPRGASNTLVLKIYNLAFEDERFGVASALGLTFFVAIAAITMTQLLITRRQEVQL